MVYDQNQVQDLHGTTNAKTITYVAWQYKTRLEQSQSNFLALPTHPTHINE